MVLAYILVFIFGCVMGSFLNCVIYRMENKRGFVKGGSSCPKCKHNLAWYDLIPVVSFLILKGRCRYCKEKISIQYLIAEIATGLLLILNFKFLILNQFLVFNFKFLITAIYLLAINSLFVLIFVYDLKHFIIPDKFVFTAIGIVFIYQLFGIWNLEFGNYGILINCILAALASSAFFFIIWLISRGKWMGFGDVKLAFLMGLFLRWPNILVAFFLAFILGSIVGLILIALKKRGMKSEIPFGPFLIAGTFIALFWGERIINWYLLKLKI